MSSPRKSMSPSSISTEKSQPPPMDTSMALVTFDTFTTQLSSSPSPPHSLDHSSESDEKEVKLTPESRRSRNQVKEEAKATTNQSPMVVVHSLPVKEIAPPPPPATKRKKTHVANRRSGAVSTILRRSKTEKVVKFTALGFRVSEIVLALISFSIMASDKTQGWSGDSFDRYKEYRFCLSVNVVAFVYSAFQACDLAYHFVKEKHLISHHLRPLFEFIMDQVLAYLLISASTAAVTRVDDWVSNWGKDEFTELVSASVAMSFFAFLAFACSSLISGYSIFNQDSF